MLVVIKSKYTIFRIRINCGSVFILVIGIDLKNVYLALQKYKVKYRSIVYIIDNH